MEKEIPLSTFVINVESKHKLSMRELKCIRYLMCDYNVREIADALCISEAGVYKILQRMLHRFNVDNHVGLIGWALYHKVLQLNPAV